ncbi:uncharacterized protein isoform X6 [Danio rerio]|uniref:Uncharacterized protein isoform X6 n=1 Tax=Danio rerio TaxID=7955 RepID=A0AC58JLN8_DANRE
MEYIWKMIGFFKGETSNCSRPEAENTSSGSRDRKRKVDEAFQNDENQEGLMPAKRHKPAQFPDDNEEPSTSSGGRKRKLQVTFQDDQEDLMPAKRRKPSQFPDDSDEPSTSSGCRGRKRKAKEAFQDDEDQEELMPTKRHKPAQFPDDNEEPTTSSGSRDRKRKVDEAFQNDENQEDLMPAKRHKPAQFPDDNEEPSTSSGGRKRKLKVTFQDDQEDLMPAKRCEPTQFPDDNEEPSTSSGCRGRKRKAKKAFQNDENQADLMPAKRHKPAQFADDSDEPSTSSGRRGRKRKAKKAFQDDEDQEDLMPATRRKPTQFPDESEEPSTSSGRRGRKRKAKKAFQDDDDQEDLMPATRHKPTQFPDESEEPSTSSGRRGRKRKVEEAFQDDENQEDLMLPPQFPDERDKPSPSSVEEASQVDEDQEDLMPAASSEPSQFPDEIEEPGTSSGSREGNAEQHFLDDEDDDSSYDEDPDFCRRDTGPGSPLDKYELGRKLGKGIYGTVYVATRKSDGKKVALKFVYMPNCYINRKPGRVFYPTSEARILLELKKPSLCPHIIELYDFFEVEEYDVLVMEYMQPSMTLTAFFRRNNGPLTESVARLLILQILIALEHCLEHGIDHRAIYEENILVNPKTLQVKLIGFGCSDYIAGDLKPHAGFDQIYCKCMWHSRLVEVGFLRNAHFALEETVECVARLLARMVNGYWPLRSMVEYPRFHPSVSKECRDLLKMCFGFNVHDGPTLEDIIDHKWFNKKIDT